MKCAKKDCDEEAVTGMLIRQDDGGFGYVSIFAVCGTHRDEVGKLSCAEECKEWFERKKKEE